MGKPTWKSFVENIRNTGAAARDERLPPGAAGGLAAVQQEVIEEMADGLRRSAEKIEQALLELDELDDAIRAATGRERRQALVEKFNQRRADALQARRNYLIRRECIGFFQNDCVIEQYPIPPKRTVVGPRGEDGELDSCEVDDTARRAAFEIIE